MSFLGERLVFQIAAAGCGLIAGYALMFSGLYPALLSAVGIDSVAKWQMSAMLFFPIGMIVTLVVGALLDFAMLAAGAVRTPFILVMALVGYLSSYAINDVLNFAFAPGHSGQLGNLTELGPACAFAGLIQGLVFWFIARPDKRRSALLATQASSTL